VVIGATVILTIEDSNVTFRATSGFSGNYRLPRISVEFPVFTKSVIRNATAVRNISCQVLSAQLWPKTTMSEAPPTTCARTLLETI
jgi:hypothetical protein